jgi:hypothetical protein
MDKRTLEEIILEQQATFLTKEPLVRRDILDRVQEYVALPHVIVISGLRRSGKSSLLKEIKQVFYPDQLVYYFNFEDEKLLHFKADDFGLLHECFVELYGPARVFFLDEIQNVAGWEIFIRRMHDAGYKFFITGSNASMLSRELGTRLTGRYIGIDLYPFSFHEFLSYHGVVIPEHPLLEDRAAIKRKFGEFIQTGGIPEYLIYKKDDIVKMLYENILYRDVMARYKLTDEKSLKELAFYLISNPGTLISYNKLRVMLGLGSVNTIKNYIFFIENAYLVFTVQKHDVSVKRQIYANKKVYIVDTSIIELLASKLPMFTAKILENAVFMELKRRGKAVFYYMGKGECDFVVVEKNVVVEAIQVTDTLASAKKREYDGLIDCMAAHGLSTGFILTEDEEFDDTIDGMTILVRPAWKWFLNIS